MPELIKILRREDLTRERAAVAVDLAPYKDILNRVRHAGGVGGVLMLGEGENRQTAKRRMSAAAKQEGYDLNWREGESGMLRFVLQPRGEPTSRDLSRQAAETERTRAQLAALHQPAERYAAELIPGTELTATEAWEQVLVLRHGRGDRQVGLL